MRLVAFLLALALVAGLAAWATRPGEEEFDAMLRAAIEAKIAKTDVGASDNTAATVLLVGCKLRPSDCFKVLRAAHDVRFEKRLFTTRAEVSGLTEATCTGVFTRFFCSRDLTAP